MSLASFLCLSNFIRIASHYQPRNCWGFAYRRWDGQAYTSTSETVPFPNDDTVHVSLYKLVEDIPQFAIQIAYLSVGEWDTYTAVCCPERPG